MGLFLLNPSAGRQSSMNPSVTARVGVNYNTASHTWSAMQQPNGNNELQGGPQDTWPVAIPGNPTTLEVRLYTMEGRLVPMQALNLAMTTVTRILRQAGVRVHWLEKDPQRFARSERTPCGSERTAPTIVINFSETPPKGLEPSVVAKAYPYARDGVRITFFRDRLQTFFDSRPSGAGSVLGHLMAHEITHVLQGISRHSETGLMRARWSPEDYMQMPSKPLPLTPYDVKLIRMGVADWSARVKADSCRSAPLK